MLAPSGVACQREDEHEIEMITRIQTASEAETRAVAARLKPLLKPGTVLALHGDLGSGKTCFVRGLAQALGCAAAVTSPTFTLLHEYPGAIPLYHADLYRLNDAQEVAQAGLLEAAGPDGVLVIEWAERAASLLPRDTIHVRLYAGGAAHERLIEIEEPDA